MDTVETDVVHGRIQQLAVEKDKTLYRVAEDGGLEKNAIYNMIQRGSLPTIKTLGKICKGLDIGLSDFFEDEQEQHTESHIELPMTEEDYFLIELFHSIREKEDRIRFLGYAQGMRDILNNKSPNKQDEK